MSESPEPEEALPPVLTASVHDVRYFAALLRGVNFVNRATVTVTERGLTITVEEARTLLGTAFIFAGVFDEYEYNPEPPQAQALRPRPPKRLRAQKKRAKKPRDPDLSSETESETEPEDANDEYHPEDDEDEEAQNMSENAAFEIPLNTLIECLNIFGTAGPTTGNIGASSESSGGSGRGRGRGGGRGRGRGGWQMTANDNDADGDDGGAGRGLDTYFGAGASEKRTGMRLSYPGGGYPLTLIIAEDASGPTTTCEITTYDPEPHLELDFDNSKTVLKIILKSSWLRDALSELDPSCDKLTFIGNPPIGPGQANANARNNTRHKAAAAKPMLRIQATGTFGSTEMDYPNDRDVLETFECTQSVKFNSYRLSHILRTVKALQSSTKTSLRIDEEGLLSLQFLMPSPKPRAAGGADAFIEFRCLAIDDQF